MRNTGEASLISPRLHVDAIRPTRRHGTMVERIFDAPGAMAGTTAKFT